MERKLSPYPAQTCRNYRHAATLRGACFGDAAVAAISESSDRANAWQSATRSEWQFKVPAAEAAEKKCV